ncbi:unnamed protein product [Rotaria magnacalcarata]|uniref:Uncharacterized protein n=1 Tax=Rotaria magnacalcarata TaxID=392030 RepID=A0A816UCP9_9BILA|nr:unnamed protein product [Rotaria magnacalcarata]CAF3855985.1 unnamed protein product [Rotaria magnacalcarata]
MTSMKSKQFFISILWELFANKKNVLRSGQISNMDKERVDEAEDGTDEAEDGTDEAEDGTDEAEDGTDEAEDGTDEAEEENVSEDENDGNLTWNWN